MIESVEAASAPEGSCTHSEWVEQLTRFTLWEHYSTRRLVQYVPPALADFNGRERERFWGLLRDWSSTLGNLARVLAGKLEEAG